MKFTPFSYQGRMIDHLLTHDDAALFAGMGLGKTVTTLTAISDLICEGASKGALIIAPIRVCAISWPHQVAHWDHTSWLKVANMRTPEGQQAWLDGTADIYLINPEMLPSIERTVKGKVKKFPGFVEKFIKGPLKKGLEIPVDILVIDELSLAKGGGTRFGSIKPFLHDMEDIAKGKKFVSPFKRRWGLTGTPAPNSYLDLYHQVKMLDNGVRLGRTFTMYKNQYFDTDFMGWKHTIKGGAKETIDKKLADLALVMQSEDYLDVPTCNTEDIDVVLPDHASKAYKTLEKELLVQLKTGEVQALSAAALTTKLLQITAGCVFDSEKETHILHDAKISALKKLRKKHPKEPLLVVTAYTHERARLLEAFPEAQMFDEKNLDKWKKGKIPMWVCAPQSMSHGVDGLQMGGRIAVWMTPTYSWESYTQLNARLVRTGQLNETIIYRILAKDTIDWAVAETLRTKEEGNFGLMLALKNLQELQKTK